ncbi:hypothetical protein EZV62_027128 [Acer yangbiense]|uniref:Uncharacterized protein n=1 Tax=Acer yangbiense TaxID=1000413 RepID=A0A5C7GST7_9ROSI|nr:hypothetical protein EZV62_027128 [Acer yangbiense]
MVDPNSCLYNVRGCWPECGYNFGKILQQTVESTWRIDLHRRTDERSAPSLDRVEERSAPSHTEERSLPSLDRVEERSALSHGGASLDRVEELRRAPELACELHLTGDQLHG